MAGKKSLPKMNSVRLSSTFYEPVHQLTEGKHDFKLAGQLPSTLSTSLRSASLTTNEARACTHFTVDHRSASPRSPAPSIRRTVRQPVTCASMSKGVSIGARLFLPKRMDMVTRRMPGQWSRAFNAPARSLRSSSASVKERSPIEHVNTPPWRHGMHTGLLRRHF